MPAQRTCAVEGCNRKPVSRGWCQTHYMRWYNHRDTGSAEIQTPQPRVGNCSVEGCERKVYAKSWCVTHYENNRLRNDPLASGPGQGKRPYPRKWEGAVCSVDGCDRPVQTSGWCTMHYDRVQRLGDPGPAAPLIAPKGAGFVNAGRYREVIPPGRKRILEHRLVMEQIIGRPLKRTENVHHRNGRRADNRPENLELWTSAQPPRQNVTDLVAWARQNNEEYGDIADALPSSKE